MMGRAEFLKSLAGLPFLGPVVEALAAEPETTTTEERYSYKVRVEGATTGWTEWVSEPDDRITSGGYLVPDEHARKVRAAYRISRTPPPSLDEGELWMRP